MSDGVILRFDTPAERRRFLAFYASVGRAITPERMALLVARMDAAQAGTRADSARRQRGRADREVEDRASAALAAWKARRAGG